MNRPLSLSDHQLAEVKRATHSLPPAKRTHFLEELAKRLGAEPTNQALHEAISLVLQLSLNRIPQFLCDSAQTNKE